MKIKRLMMITAPVSSRSGYGNHARDLVISLINMNKFNIKIQDCRWGNCPRNALDTNIPEHKKIMDCIMVDASEMTTQPDVYIDIRIPHEYQRYGKFNIGITAGVETDLISGEWIEAANQMDLNIVPSKHSKDGFMNTSYDKMMMVPSGEKQKVGETRIEKPVEVLFEGSDEDIYKPLTPKEIDEDFFDMLNEKVPEKFAFLSVGMWGNGGFGEDRKDLGTTVKVFYETFANKKKQPALILKTSGATFGIIEKQKVLDKLNAIKQRFPKEVKLPNVYLLHGDLSDSEMNMLYNHPKVKAMFSLTHGEGYGRPLQEATMVGLPVIASNWSGQVDFLDTKNCILLAGKLVQVPQSAVWEKIIVPQSRWFNVEESQAYKALDYTFHNIEILKRKAKDLMKKNREKFTLAKMQIKFEEILDSYLKVLPAEVEFKLPNLSTTPKIKLPTLKKAELPNLEKTETTGEQI